MKAWDLQADADVWAMEFEAEACNTQARMMYKKRFPKVMLATGLVDHDFGTEKIMICGQHPQKQEQFAGLLRACEKYMATHKASIVLCLANSRPPAELEGFAGWTKGTHEMSWSLFSSFEASTFATIYCKDKPMMPAARLAKYLAQEMGRVLQSGAHTCVDRQLQEPMIDLPPPPSDAEQSPAITRQLKVQAAAAKLKASLATDKSKFRYIDASRKSHKVCLTIPTPTKRSILLSASPETTQVGRVCLVAAMGYDSTIVNLSMQPCGRQPSILCSSLPAHVSATMLNAAAKVLAA